jgi:hypothetical protein
VPNKQGIAGRRRVGLGIFLAALALWGGAPARAAGPPQIGDLWVSNVVARAARLNGEVNRNGFPTAYHFEYVTSAEFKTKGFTGARRIPVSADAQVPLGAATFSNVSQNPSTLEAGTSYRYRLVAQNSAGTAVSSAFSFVTQSLGGGKLLLDSRGWELVSPADKNGGAIQGFGQNYGGDVLQAAEAGSAVTYTSLSSFGQDALGAPPASQYISRRGVGGWSTENVSGPTVSGAYGEEPDGVPYQLFSADLGRGVLFDGEAYELLNEDGSLTAIPAEGSKLFLASASPDLRHIVVSLEGNLYEYSEGQLKQINVGPGAELGAQSGAVSSDGLRIYFAEGGNLHLRNGAQIVQVDDEVGGGGGFETATPSGSFAFFTKGGHLYRYEAQFEDLSTLDLTPSGGVEGVLGASEDGTHVYYATAAGLFLWHNGTTTEVAAAVDASNYPPTTGTARVSADGTRLVFLSKASLTGYDNTDSNTKEPDAEVFLYNSEAPPGEAITCLSCNPTEARPLGPSTVPGASPNGDRPTAIHSYKPRVLAAGGSRVFFDSEDALVLADINNGPDVYEWEAEGTGSCATAGGCLALVSAGQGEAGASFVDASGSGADAFFLTGESLVKWADPGSFDLYDAREGGGFPEPQTPSVCKGDSCQPLPSSPEDRSVGTLASGPGNPRVRYSKQGHHRKRHRHSKHHGRNHHGSRR